MVYQTYTYTHKAYTNTTATKDQGKQDTSKRLCLHGNTARQKQCRPNLDTLQPKIYDCAVFSFALKRFFGKG